MYKYKSCTRILKYTSHPVQQQSRLGKAKPSGAHGNIDLTTLPGIFYHMRAKGNQAFLDEQQPASRERAGRHVSVIEHSLSPQVSMVP